jgi:hypothetical protein
LTEAVHHRTDLNQHLLHLVNALTSFVEGRRQLGVDAIIQLLHDFPAFVDPEGLYYWSYCLAGHGETDRALELLSRSAETGLSCVRALSLPPFLELKDHPRFIEIVAHVTARQEAATRAFEEAGGPRLLGLAQRASSQSG